MVCVAWVPFPSQLSTFSRPYLGYKNLTKPIIRTGVDVNLKDDRHGVAALHAAVSTAQLDLVQILIENEANVNLKTKYGDAAIHQAAKNGK